MKRVVLALALATAVTQPACYGRYGATKSLNRWNGQATGNKVANSAIHLGLWIVPIYPLAIVGDFLIFNNIEFLTGAPVFR